MAGRSGIIKGVVQMSTIKSMLQVASSMIWICQSVGLCAVLRGVGHVPITEGCGLGRCQFSGEDAPDPGGNVCVGQGFDAI